jgi:pimeloyl-ACP methyl ester carboxylesterase
VSARLEVRKAEVDGRLARYRVIGSGEPLVLVHGLGGSWRWWSPLLAELGKRREVHAVDLPRPRKVVRAVELSAWLGRWLDASGLRHVDLAGHSLGGLVAAELAARRWELTRRLVLLAPAGIPDSRSVPARVLPLLRELYGIRSSLRIVAGDALRAGPFTLTHGVVVASTRDLRSELAEIRAPTLLLWGERDRLVPPRVAEEWQRMLPDARLVRLSCGHVPMLEAPGEVADLMLSFLDEELGDDLGD